MFQNNIFSYSLTLQDEPDSTPDKEDALPSPRPRRYSQKAIFTTAIIALISILCFAFAVFEMLQLTSPALLSPDSFFPDFPSVKMKFVEGEDNDFMRFDEVGDAAWNGMIPSTLYLISPPHKYLSLTAESDGAGYVRVDRPRRYDMESSVPYGLGNEDAEVYQASVVHQLHCLGTLRLVLAAYARHERLENYYDSEPHMRHCLNILRQGILCASDATLAFSKPTGRTEEGLFTAKFNNIGTVHTCRSWEAVRAFLEGHRAMDRNATVGST
ncbi:hypothetical protein HBI95_039020 [Parastagonospora nodorum]|nr:hypothetical protein HBI95_039020 [Parastagonospora nodorum]KAH5656768.1 hypothetical protein HBI51_024680 [Parastagonospora nodorum]